MEKFWASKEGCMKSQRAESLLIQVQETVVEERGQEMQDHHMH